MPEAVVDEPDPQVVKAARSGDLGAFEALVRRYQGDVWRLSYHLVRDETVADDITQDAFVRAFRFMRRYRGDAKFSTWLFSIARNCAMDELRRSARRTRVVQRVEAELQSPPQPGEQVGIEIRELIGRLPLELREPIVLIDMFGMSYREVARIMRVPEGTIKSRVHRARHLLAGELRPRREESSHEG
jgi:RNA polymerase sigma-70 factor (ECF subfamily)